MENVYVAVQGVGTAVVCGDNQLNGMSPILCECRLRVLYAVGAVVGVPLPAGQVAVGRSAGACEPCRSIGAGLACTEVGLWQCIDVYVFLQDVRASHRTASWRSGQA